MNFFTAKIKIDTQYKKPLLITVLLFLSIIIHSAYASESAIATEPTLPQYVQLKTKLMEYQIEANQHGNWPSITPGDTLTIGSNESRVIMLRQRLAYPNINHDPLMQVESPQLFGTALALRVKEFQIRHGLIADGTVGTQTLEALNVPLSVRITQINANLQRLQDLLTQLHGTLAQQYVMVNVPDFSLSVVNNGKTVLNMPVIVGNRRGLHSCLLNSQITALQLNPYWYIPRSIAVKDLLPIIKQNPQYLADNNIRVFTGYGADGDEIDGSSINWRNLTAQNFPYKLREEPGDDNPLGQIKFIFSNSCGIYLHDTSNPKLFDRSRRDFSHGCIRIAKPLALAVYLLNDGNTTTPTWSEQRLNNIIESGDTRWIALKHPVAIYVVYQTAWVDESGSLQLRNDIYGLDQACVTTGICK